MRPIKTDETTFTYKLQGGTEENDLPSIRDETTNTVTSFWVVEDVDNLTDKSESLYVWIIGTADVPVEAAWADTLDDAEFSFQQVSADADGDGWVGIALEEKQRNWLRAGSALVLRVHAIPTPPVSMNLDTYRSPEPDPQARPTGAAA